MSNWAPFKEEQQLPAADLLSKLQQQVSDHPTVVLVAHWSKMKLDAALKGEHALLVVQPGGCGSSDGMLLWHLHSTFNKAKMTHMGAYLAVAAAAAAATVSSCTPAIVFPADQVVGFWEAKCGFRAGPDGAYVAPHDPVGTLSRLSQAVVCSLYHDKLGTQLQLTVGYKNMGSTCYLGRQRTATRSSGNQPHPTAQGTPCCSRLRELWLTHCSGAVAAAIFCVPKLLHSVLGYTGSSPFLHALQDVFAKTLCPSRRGAAPPSLYKLFQAYKTLSDPVRATSNEDPLTKNDHMDPHEVLVLSDFVSIAGCSLQVCPLRPAPELLVSSTCPDVP